MNHWLQKTKGIFDPDGSLTWRARVTILTFSFVAALLAAKYSREPFLLWLAEDWKNNDIVQFAVALVLFGAIFGLGHWLIKSHDVKKQFRDTFIEQNELLFANAVRALFDESSANEKGVNVHENIIKLPVDRKAVNGHGLQELARIFDKGLIERDRIDSATGAGLNFRGANFHYAVLRGLNLRSVQLAEASLVGADLRRTIFLAGDLRKAILRYAKLRGADLRYADMKEADLRAADLSIVDLSKTVLEGALYDENTQFPLDFDPEEHGLIKKEMNG